MENVDEVIAVLADLVVLTREGNTAMLDALMRLSVMVERLQEQVAQLYSPSGIE